MQLINDPSELQVGQCYWVRPLNPVEHDGPDGIAFIEEADGKQMHVEHPFFAIESVASREDRGWRQYAYCGPIPSPSFNCDTFELHAAPTFKTLTSRECSLPELQAALVHMIRLHNALNETTGKILSTGLPTKRPVDYIPPTQPRRDRDTQDW